MEFNVLSTHCLAMWPPELDISDGVVYHYSVGEGFRSGRLATAWEKAAWQAELLGEGHALLTWLLYKSLHAMAWERFLKQTYSLTVELIQERVAQVRADLLEHLHEPGYVDMLTAYERANS
jgi:hypothetical protein